MVGLVSAMAFHMVLRLVGWVVCNNKPLPNHYHSLQMEAVISSFLWCYISQNFWESCPVKESHSTTLVLLFGLWTGSQCRFALYFYSLSYCPIEVHFWVNDYPSSISRLVRQPYVFLQRNPVARISQQGGQHPQRGGYIFKRNIGCMQQPGAKHEMGAQILNEVERATLAPRWRRPCSHILVPMGAIFL